jgi:hypothetical protein
VGKTKGTEKPSHKVEKLKGDSPVSGGKHQPAGGEEAEGASIERVRDILFGAQVRDFEKRFARVEERMTKEVSALMDETRKRFDSLENYFRKEIESVTAQLKVEQGERAESSKELSGEIKDTNKLFEKKIGRLDEQLSKHSSELRQQILEQYKNLSDEIRQKHEETSDVFNQLAQELRAEKVDLSTLSELFVEMALRLNDNLASKLNLEVGSLDNE